MVDGTHAGQLELRDLEGKVGDASFKVTAKLGKPPDWSGTELSISASGPDVGQLLPPSTIEQPLSFSLSGQASKNETGIRVSKMEAELKDYPLRSKKGNKINLDKYLGGTGWKTGYSITPDFWQNSVYFSYTPIP